MSRATHLHLVAESGDLASEWPAPSLQSRWQGKPPVAPKVVPCDFCGTQLTLEMARLELVNHGAFHRCPYCYESSKISWQDAITVNGHLEVPVGGQVKVPTLGVCG